MAPKGAKKVRKTPSKGVIKERKEHVLSSLEQLGSQVYDQLSKKEFPTFKMPSRSIANIIYDDKTRQYILGKRNVKRSARNVRHIRPFTQLLWTAMFTDQYAPGCFLFCSSVRNGFPGSAGERQSDY